MPRITNTQNDARRITHVHQPLLPGKIRPTHSYRVPYCPINCNDEQQHWPTVRVRATDAIDAQHKARLATGCAVGDATRIEN